MVECGIYDKFVVNIETREASILFSTNGDWKCAGFVVSQSKNIGGETDVVCVAVYENRAVVLGLLQHPVEIADLVFAVVFHTDHAHYKGNSSFPLNPILLFLLFFIFCLE
jgi:hypothetical protein